MLHLIWQLWHSEPEITHHFDDSPVHKRMVMDASGVFQGLQWRKDSRTPSLSSGSALIFMKPSFAWSFSALVPIHPYSSPQQRSISINFICFLHGFGWFFISDSLHQSLWYLVQQKPCSFNLGLGPRNLLRYAGVGFSPPSVLSPVLWPRNRRLAQMQQKQKSTDVQTSPWLALRQSSGQGLEFGPYYGRLTPLFHGMVDSDMNPATLFMWNLSFGHLLISEVLPIYAWKKKKTHSALQEKHTNTPLVDFSQIPQIVWGGGGYPTRSSGSNINQSEQRQPSTLNSSNCEPLKLAPGLVLHLKSPAKLSDPSGRVAEDILGSKNWCEKLPFPIAVML